jgi:hypothetical protein
MTEPAQLLGRLDDIAASLATRPEALALIGLGSVGLELERLDRYSDLDFFVIVAPGHKTAYLDDLNWLAAAHPLAYTFLNTPDGYKVLFDDSIFCELAVFELEELKNIPYAPGRVIWKRESVPDSIAIPPPMPGARPEPTLEWLVGEALTNLYVGLGRYHRGEKLSALRFIQGYAVDRLVELIARIAPPATGSADPFTAERRFEMRYPQFAGRFTDFLQGYERSPQSALAILAFLQEHFEVNPAMAREINNLSLIE